MPQLRPAAARRRRPRPRQEERIVEHPDGYYWIADDGKQEFGPFESYELARTDRDALSEEAIAPGEALHEAEREAGIADLIDIETGPPSEGELPP